MLRKPSRLRAPSLGARKTRPRSYFFPLELIPEKDGRWTIDVPSLPGCVTWGRTREEALKHAQEAIELYLADMIEAGESLPGSVFVSETPTVTVTV